MKRGAGAIDSTAVWELHWEVVLENDSQLCVWGLFTAEKENDVVLGIESGPAACSQLAQLSFWLFYFWGAERGWAIFLAVTGARDLNWFCKCLSSYLSGPTRCFILRKFPELPNFQRSSLSSIRTHDEHKNCP